MLKKILQVGGGALALLIGGLAVFIGTFSPAQRRPLDLSVGSDAALVERGAYLVRAVTMCGDCHSKRDWTRYGAPEVEELGGGYCWKPEYNFPGEVCGSNITQHKGTGIGAWSDGEILRAIREGVDRDGKGLAPMMPYTEWARLSDEDGKAIVAYLRTVDPIDNQVQPPRIDFPVSFFMKMAPQPLSGPVKAPPRASNAAYGEYLATIAGCKVCHTPVDDKHQPIAGMEFAGGQPFPGPYGNVNSANLTPHETGIEALDRDSFIAKFKAFANIEEVARKIDIKENTVMPWLAFGQMTEEDLGAIYDYLRTVKPIDQTVAKR